MAEDHLWSSGLGPAAPAWLPAAGTGHTTLTPNHTAVPPIQKMNGIQFSLGTSELITFNESNNSKELSVYTVLSAAWLVHHPAVVLEAIQSGREEHPAGRHCPPDILLVLTGIKRCISSPEPAAKAQPAQQPFCFAGKTAGHSI